MPKATVVFDTSVLITLPVAASLSTRLFQRLEAAGWKVAASPQILLELADKLHTKESLRTWLAVPDDQIEVFLNETIRKMVMPVPGHRQAHGAVPADPKDDMVIAAALEAKAKYIISEDTKLVLDRVPQQVTTEQESKRRTGCRNEADENDTSPEAEEPSIGQRQASGTGKRKPCDRHVD